MPINNLSQSLTPFEQSEGQELLEHLKAILARIAAKGTNLTKDERVSYSKIAENNKLLVGKVSDYHVQQPVLQSPDVPWDRFDTCWSNRKFLEAVESLCNSIMEASSDTRILYDHDLYKMSLDDYDYTKYKANSTNAASGFTTKYDELKQFFGNPTGKNGRGTDSEDEASDTPVTPTT
jgi:hypothetical protein